jgi:hypothetical protein
MDARGLYKETTNVTPLTITTLQEGIAISNSKFLTENERELSLDNISLDKKSFIATGGGPPVEARVPSGLN